MTLLQLPRSTSLAGRCCTTRPVVPLKSAMAWTDSTSGLMEMDVTKKS